jgi:hypothetical protein
MKIKDILQRDPATYPLVNQGQARISDKKTEREIDELKGELSTFVCEGQFAEGMQNILSSYLTNLAHTSQRAAWVSGFYGSGKSHFEKMLCHLWQDTSFPDGSTARALVPSLPDEIRNLLRELDTAGKRAGGLLAAAGSLPSGTTENVRLTILGILLRAVNFPDQYPQAQFCLWLHDQDYFERVKGSVENAGRNWLTELDNLYVSGPIANAVRDCDPNFAASEVEGRKTIREQFPPKPTDISTAEFLNTFKRVLKLCGRDGRLPCTVLVLDEVQQYIGESAERSTLVTEAVEALSKQFDSHVIVVAAGQSALTEVRLLNKLMDRFTIRVPLSDADVETVTRKVLLQKKPSAVAAIREKLDIHAGEISRELQGTRIAESPNDRNTIVEDYPLLPVRRRFWENCFRQVDAAGTHSQLRSQLRIIHDAVAKLSDQPLGSVIPGDELYEALAPDMVISGVLLREINDRIINLSKDGDNNLAQRICGLVFLIGKLPHESAADLGVRATKTHIADLLVDDLAGDNAKLRSDVEAGLNKLSSDGVLMRIGDEFRLQTKEGSEWDREFRNRQTKLANDDPDLFIRRDTFLYAEADRVVRKQKIIQGASKESRQFAIFRDQNAPQGITDSIPVWIRDQWSCSQKDVVEAARSAGSDSPIIYVFIPKQSDDDLRRLIVEAEAANQTLDFKGHPSTDEGSEARRGMETRYARAVQERDALIAEIVANSKVFQGGGAELLQQSLELKLQEGATASLIRLFPRFNEADALASAWEAAIKRAREGSDQPFQLVGWRGSTEQHPVCQQVINTIGSGKTGTDVRKALRSSPFGWPQDAIDAALIALHRLQHISAILNGAPVQLGQLDQNKIAKAEFRVEKSMLSVQERLIIRKLYGQLKIQCRAGEEGGKAAEFLVELSALAVSAGGPSPLPAAPSVVEIDDIKNLFGNEQLAAIVSKATQLEQSIKDWTTAKELSEQRRPVWDLVERLSRHASSLSSAAEQVKQVNAIRDNRMLLDSTDHVSPLRSALAGLLRAAINEAHANHENAYQTGIDTLESNEMWDHIPEPTRNGILAQVGLVAPPKFDMSTDDALLVGLDAHPLAAQQADADAIAGRIQRALELAAKHLEPKVHTVRIERTTLRNDEEVRQWVKRQEQVLLEEVKKGPVLVN